MSSTSPPISWQQIVLGLAVATTLTVSSLARAQIAAADAARAQADPPRATAAQQAAGPIEQVIVTGQRKLGSLIREGAELTEDFYLRLNAVLDNDDFRIDCHSELPTGSHISRRICQTRFQQRLQERQAASIIQNIEPDESGQLDLTNFNGTMETIGAELMARSQDFENAVLEAVNTDAELNEQFIRLVALKSAVENFETPRARRSRERDERRLDGESD